MARRARRASGQTSVPERRGVAGLPERLAELRTGWRLTQRALADALGLEPPSVSGWENGRSMPTPDRLEQYALLFATRRSLDGGLHLLDPSELTADEADERDRLEAELAALAGPASGPVTSPGPATTAGRGQLGGRFWYFPDGAPVTILCTPFSCRQFGVPGPGQVPPDAPPVVQYAVNPAHPNAVTNLLNADVDALLELVGHLRAENPQLDVRWKTYDTIADTDLITGHLVMLGGADNGNMESTPMQSPAAPGAAMLFRDLRSRLRPPVWVSADVPEDEEYDFPWVDAGGTEYRPEFMTLEGGRRLTNSGAPVLTSDVALVMRRANPYNPAYSATMLSGLFSRGTYAAVRSFTDAAFREDNERFWAEHLDPADFWLLLRVKVAGGLRTITPSLVPQPAGEPADLLASSAAGENGATPAVPAASEDVA